MCYFNGLQGDASTDGPHSASHGQARKGVMQGLPQVVLDAAKVVKVVIKAYKWADVRCKPPSYNVMIDVIMKFLHEFGAPRLCVPPAWDSCFNRHYPRPFINLSSDCYMLWKFQKSEYRNFVKDSLVVVKGLEE